jgi:hypothetical protein
MGYTFAAGDWMQPANDTAAPAITDALHALLVKRRYLPSPNSSPRLRLASRQAGHFTLTQDVDRPER